MQVFSRAITTFNFTYTLHIINKLTKFGSNSSISEIACLCSAHTWTHFYFLAMLHVLNY